MYRVSTARFLKRKTCPSTDVLILYGEAELTRVREERVASHLADCDFCGAEMQMLAKHWRHDLPALQHPCEIPSHLRCLAEELMAVPTFERARFVETICELDRMTLTDVA